ncbi:MAG: biosynthetic peptidoglycan transglycosylase [Sphingomonas sp.]
MFRSCLFRLLLIPFAVLLLLAGYEAVQVLRARAATPAALKTVAKRELRLADLGVNRRNMLLRVEDPGFYRHHGLDFATPGSGWTTITQGLVKHLYFPDGFNPGFAKIEQSLIAWLVLDPAVTKDEQLEIYLNYAYLGNSGGYQVFGFPAAARIYYGRELTRLSDREYLSLVAMLIAPNEYSPRTHPQANARRVDRIVRLLRRQCAPTSWRDVVYPDCDVRPSTGPADRAPR